MLNMNPMGKSSHTVSDEEANKKRKIDKDS